MPMPPTHHVLESMTITSGYLQNTHLSFSPTSTASSAATSETRIKSLGNRKERCLLVAVPLAYQLTRTNEATEAG